MDKLLKAATAVLLVAPLALALAMPTTSEAPAVSGGYEELTTYFDDLATANDSEAQDGANRVLTGFGYGFGNQHSGLYPGYPQGAGYPLNNWQNNYDYYGGRYQRKCSRWCPGSTPGLFVCCVPSHPNEPSCPEVRPTCTDPYHYSGPPRPCESSQECMSGSLCCFDMCLRQKTCKPAHYG
ncbi:uncharacterized protein LOC122266493 [Penaeus japonicus]|uniref:uncharacterized protein LOC122266493 n=1 Tax=Penaeus japonicus TaxID=27405 RepID=UPI001C70B50C|nr:uncharacterized protein LOC122266493 [Penaeus japonicus]XP_042892209.1 uncharacterized protein LOC122266493 [Penaeus japonicus]